MNYDHFLSRAGERMQESAIRKMGTVLAQARDVISFAPGYPDPATFPWEDFRDIAADLLSGADPNVLQYGPTRGCRPLLEAIAAIMQARDIQAGLEHLLVTTGSQQGLDLVARVLVDPEDAVLVELPTYTGAIAAFQNVRAQLVGVRQEPDGIDLGHLEDVLAGLRREGRRTRVLYVVPNFQNPTGLLMSREKRRALLESAARHDLLIVEDDPYRDLYFEDTASPSDVRSLKADDEEGRVVYLSSFSKTIAPGFRVAWIAAPAALASKLEMAKQASDLLTGALDQRIVYEACRRGVLERRMPGLRRHYQDKRNVIQEALNRELKGRLTWARPHGGFFLWTTAPAPLSADDMLARAVRHGVIYVAGSAFFVDGSGANTLRLSFSAPTPERIIEGVRRLAAALDEELSAGSRGAAAATERPGAS